MKALNLMLLAYGGAIVLILSLSMIVERYAGHDNGIMTMMPVGLLVGLSARRVTEKILGYTLLEALQEKKDESRN